MSQWQDDEEEPPFAKGMRAASAAHKGRHRVATVGALSLGIVLGGGFRFLPIAAWFAGIAVALAVLIWQTIVMLRARWLAQEISREAEKKIKIVEPKEKAA